MFTDWLAIPTARPYWIIDDSYCKHQVLGGKKCDGHVWTHLWDFYVQYTVVEEKKLYRYFSQVWCSPELLFSLSVPPPLPLPLLISLVQVIVFQYISALHYANNTICVYIILYLSSDSLSKPPSSPYQASWCSSPLWDWRTPGYTGIHKGFKASSTRKGGQVSDSSHQHLSGKWRQNGKE